MTDNPLVSIVILNYNGHNYLERCLSSVMQLDYPNFEVLVVDNCSYDGSVYTAKEKFPSIRIIENKENIGYAGGMNSGILNARGELITFLCMDTEVHSGWLSAVVKVLQSSPDVGASFGKFYCYDNKQKFAGANALFRINKKLRFTEVAQEASVVPGSVWIGKSKAIKSVGLLDDKYFMYFEEFDLSWRLRIAGFKLMYTPDAIAYHREGSQLETEKKIYYHTRNWIRSLLKNCSGKALVLYSWFIPLKYILALINCFKFEEKYRRTGQMRLVCYSKACFWNFLNLKDTLYRRRDIQTMRKVSDRELCLFNFVLSNTYADINRSLLL